jgi:tetratricopeptide (TPR) repeat protein
MCGCLFSFLFGKPFSYQLVDDTEDYDLDETINIEPTQIQIADAIVEKTSKEFDNGLETMSYDEARQLHEKAVCVYKMEKVWDKAADALEGLADYYHRDKSLFLAVVKYKDAIECFMRADNFEGAVCCAKKAISSALEMGDIFEIAKLEYKLAWIMEKMGDIDGAIEHLEQAAICYDGYHDYSRVATCNAAIERLTKNENP